MYTKELISLALNGIQHEKHCMYISGWGDGPCNCEARGKNRGQPLYIRRVEADAKR